jgi:hypothetical protein
MNSTNRNFAGHLESSRSETEGPCRTCLMVDELIEQLIRKQMGEAQSRPLTIVGGATRR